MDPDTALVTGMVMGALSIPSILSALSEGRSPRLGSVLVLMAGGLMIYALTQKQGGYTMAEIPDVFFKVIARFAP